jgi:NADH-quinone oxidoreductase subunit K
MGDIAGQIFVFFIMAVAAGEATIGLAIVLALFRLKQSVYVDEANSLKL